MPKQPHSLPRNLTGILRDHLAKHRQMAFVTGPRQTGKTTLVKGLVDHMLNWDAPADARLILAGPEAVAQKFSLDRTHAKLPVIAFDELHKHRHWKSFLKGFYDTYADQCRILVTGSARLDIFRRGGDSLMGRYFLFHLHPFSVGELIDSARPDAITIPPAPLKEKTFQNLLKNGGYPDPFVKADPRFTLRWHELRQHQLLREDIRELSPTLDLKKIEILAQLLAERSGEQLVVSNLAQDLQSSPETVGRWIDTLESLHFGFRLRPWFQNVARSLRKEPKWFLRDWSGIDDPGRHTETFIACHLLKAVDTWNDLGLGRFELRYLRDKEKHEVDFLIVRDRKPWCLVEAKHGETQLSASLKSFQTALKTPFAFQAVMDFPYEPVDCFAPQRAGKAWVTPVRTLLSQLP